MLGIQLPINFNWPYLACSLTEFWDRWHISLSRWIRDYLYIPLGGNRCGLLRKTFNGLVAFAICGLWHGAAFNFVVWGLYHGVGLAICSNYRRLLGPLGNRLGDWLAVNRAIAWALTMLFVGIGWLLFFYSVPQAMNMTRLLFRA
jgi:alginate O-acetyltransferase complex protein AlgI